MPSGGEEPEHLLCDTSFVGHQARRLAKPEFYDHWPSDVLDRIEAAIKGISVITVAEQRRGYLKAHWGPKKVEMAEHRLASYVPVPLDGLVLDDWARLKQLSEENGWGVGDNDLWIAATAATRGMPLVSCDKDHARMGGCDGLEIVYLAPPKH